MGTDRSAIPSDPPFLHDASSIYHTHGAPAPGKDVENFSGLGPDGRGDTGLSDDLGLPDYLGTPSFTIKKYDPCTHRVIILQRGA